MSSNPAVTPDMLVDQLMNGMGDWNVIGPDAHTKMMASVDRGDFDSAAELAAGLFATEGGQAFLQFLIGQTLLMATWPGDVMAGDQLATYGAHREGQNSIVVLIHALIARGHELQPPEETPHD